MKSTQDLYLAHRPAKDTDPDAARETLNLLQQYGLEVPPEKWRKALRGIDSAEEKLTVSEELPLRTAEPQEQPELLAFAPASVVDPAFALEHDVLMSKPPYFFAALQSKTESINKKLKACKRFDKACSILCNHFYVRTELGLPENFYFYSNGTLNCGVLFYAEEGLLYSHWFLNV